MYGNHRRLWRNDGVLRAGHSKYCRVGRWGGRWLVAQLWVDRHKVMAYSEVRQLWYQLWAGRRRGGRGHMRG